MVVAGTLPLALSNHRCSAEQSSSAFNSLLTSAAQPGQAAWYGRKKAQVEDLGLVDCKG